MQIELRRNILFNYIGHFYITFVGILILPLFLKYLGAEAFGLIAFFALLQSWLQLLDVGMTPTMGREVARLRVHENLKVQLRSVVRSLETIFISIGVLIFIIVFLARDFIAEKWLNAVIINSNEVALCIGVVAFVISIRWIGSLYRSGINAYEQQVWMNIFDIIFISLKSPIALLIVVTLDKGIVFYFIYQAIIVFIEQLLIMLKFSTLLPSISPNIKLFSFSEIKRIMPFALGIAYTSGIWIFTTQLDKLMLSKILNLSEFGYFTLIATVASGLAVLSGPISKAVLPRMTALLSQGKEHEMLHLYRRATRIIVCIISPMTIILSLYAKEVVLVWTDNQNATEWIAPILPFYIIGNGLLAILAFQYYLQYAHGQLKYHVRYNTFYAILVIPLIIISVLKYGAIGAGYVWLFSQLMTILLWVPFIHYVFSPGLHWKWLVFDVVVPILSAICYIYTFYIFFYESFPDSQVLGVFYFIILAITSILFCLVINFPFYFKRFICAIF